MIRAAVTAQITILHRDGEATIRVDLKAARIRAPHQVEGAMILVGSMSRMTILHLDVATSKEDHMDDVVMRGRGVGHHDYIHRAYHRQKRWLICHWHGMDLITRRQNEYMKYG
jgi:hypothetical protein